MTEDNRLQKETLKNQALNERIAQLVAQYENQIAEFRAESTLVIGELRNTISTLEAKVQEANESIQEEIPAEPTEG